MRVLLLAFLALVSSLSDGRGQQEQTVNELLGKVRAELPKGWTASYNKEDLRLEVSRDDAVPSLSAFPNGPPGEKPERRKYAFAFFVIPAVSPAEHRRLSAENARIQKEADALYQDLVKRHVSHKFDSFLPQTDSEKADVARYEALIASFHFLPNFYFRDISLLWPPGARQIIVTDDKILKECAQVQERVVALFSKYETPD